MLEKKEGEATKSSIIDLGIGVTAVVLSSISLGALMQDYRPDSTLATVVVADLGLFAAGMAASLYRFRQAVRYRRLEDELLTERTHTLIGQSQLPPTLSQ